MIRLGLIDFDSSHSVEFAQRFNGVGVDADQRVDGARVVLGWPGTSEMAPHRIADLTEQVAQCGVELVAAPEQLLGRVDAVLVHSLCGAAHLNRARPFLEAGVPTFVDKPFALNTAEAREMVLLARKHGTLLLSASGLRFADEVQAFRRDRPLSESLHGLLTHGPAKRAPGNPGLFHYGIHAVELLFELMGSGCRTAACTSTLGADVLTAVWNDGRIATVRGNRAGSTAYGFVAFCEAGVVHRHVSTRYAYRNLCRAIVESFRTGTPAVDPQQAFEVVALIEAALESERHGGKPVELPRLDESNHPFT